MNLKAAMALHADYGFSSWLVHPPGLKTDTPQVRDMARRRLVKTNPDIDAGGPGKAAKYKEKSQTDNAGFIGKKYRVKDHLYGHLVSEHDTLDEATRAALTRPYSSVLSHPEPEQLQKNRNKSRKKLVRKSPDDIY